MRHVTNEEYTISHPSKLRNIYQRKFSFVCVVDNKKGAIFMLDTFDYGGVG